LDHIFYADCDVFSGNAYHEACICGVCREMELERDEASVQELGHDEVSVQECGCYELECRILRYDRSFYLHHDELEQVCFHEEDSVYRLYDSLHEADGL